MDLAGRAYTAEDTENWSREASEFGRIAQETPELANIRERMRSQAEDPSARAQMYQRLQQGIAQKQAMRAAYAKGYNPAAQRAAMEQYADAQTNISASAQELEQQDAQRALQAYGQIMQQRQKMQLAAAEARSAYIMGNQKIATQALDSARRANVSAQGVAMQEAQAKADATVKMQTALISAGGTLLASKSDWFSGSQKAPPVQNIISGGPAQTAQPGADFFKQSQTTMPA
jgi:hypothetical protein